MLAYHLFRESLLWLAHHRSSNLLLRSRSHSYFNYPRALIRDCQLGPPSAQFKVPCRSVYVCRTLAQALVLIAVCSVPDDGSFSIATYQSFHPGGSPYRGMPDRWRLVVWNLGDWDAAHDAVSAISCEASGLQMSSVSQPTWLMEQNSLLPVLSSGCSPNDVVPCCCHR